MPRWMQLRDFGCPLNECPSRSKKLTWTCRKDGDYTFVNEHGQIKCESGAHIGDVCTWRWNCGNGYHNGEFLRADLEGFTFALSMAVQMTNRAGANWVSSLVQALGRQYNNM